MLPLHVGGDLDPKHVGTVDAHLKQCLSCFREFREFAVMRGRLGVLAEKPLPEGVLEGFTEEVMARIQVGEPGPAAVPMGLGSVAGSGHLGVLARFPALQRLAAAAAVLIVCTAGWRYFSDDALASGGERLQGNEQVLTSPVSGLQSPAPTPVDRLPLGFFGTSLDPKSSSPGYSSGSRDLLMSVPPNMQGLRPLSQEEVLLFQSSGGAGTILIIRQGEGAGLEAVDSPAVPRERLR